MSEKPKHINITLPVYYTQTFKTKPDKKIFVAMNWWRNCHYHIKNEVKQWFNTETLKQLTAQDAKPIKGPYETAFVYYFKTATTDLGNVCALASKHVNDSFQSYGLVENDNVKFCRKEAYYVGEQDKDNPRVEIFVRPWVEKEQDD